MKKSKNKIFKSTDVFPNNKKFIATAKYICTRDICESCYGSGKLEERWISSMKVEGKQIIDCPTCKGSGKNA